ncbi:ABC transporter substrate-binding protein [Bordetella trematum]|uniref:Putattive exported protein n=1 Tax=Bordetella trematum TaxID=123899 RepID=A0A146B023_9BORD|nr:tripartite tricarboxylate transporter substrate binding protein [Bordetella trematum]AUL46272.1 ABC transporter substrate-binding protein [Bordetella trematum]AZR93041.1 ABC transporter substrate-binding protein [Bordetella trematum]NNH19288.1 tripartite tricarboxylate transporter substrate binding protein [Bordetella trematum]QIM71640.1 tripartite tricarboxylate transporter substrate binding protein [Bordetella trematum]CZZ95726.1 putattive exported protein [Bordetella trematum]
MLRRALLALTLTLLAPLALAAYPDKPLRLIINNPAGGPVDAMARLLGTRLGERWGQPVIVENRPGASGMISVNALTKAAPDGYTLGLVVASTVTIVPFAVSNFDPVDALTPISLVARTPFVFVVAADSPLRSWEDFVAASKARELNLGSFSIGTAFHLVWEQTARRAGIQALYAPSSSSGKTLNDLIGGQLDIALDAPSSAKGLLDSGRLRALAITSPQRFANLPDTPTLQEAGMDGYAAQPWIGLMGPAGLSAEQAAFIGDSVAEVLQEPAMRQQMQQLGMIPIGGDARALRETIAAERAEMAPLVRELGIRLQ